MIIYSSLKNSSGYKQYLYSQKIIKCMIFLLLKMRKIKKVQNFSVKCRQYLLGICLK